MIQPSPPSTPETVSVPMNGAVSLIHGRKEPRAKEIPPPTARSIGVVRSSDSFCVPERAADGCVSAPAGGCAGGLYEGCWRSREEPAGPLVDSVGCVAATTVLAPHAAENLAASETGVPQLVHVRPAPRSIDAPDSRRVAPASEPAA